MQEEYLDSALEVLNGDDSCTIYQARNNDGDGMMTVYDVMDGIKLIYNDFHTTKYKSDFVPNCWMFCVDHCREGRIEQEVSQGVLKYIESGDLRIDNRNNHNTNFYMPLSHYHGITLAFNVLKAEKSIHKIFPDFPVSIKKLSEKYCKSNEMFFLRSQKEIDHIFNELYAVPKKIRKYYYKIKIFELLLYLDALEVESCKSMVPYFYKSQTEKVKSIHKLITSDLQTHYTLNYLSDKHEISLTSMKKCFKAIYGDSIYSYIKKYKMNKAATLLRTTNLNIATIANEVGYDSPSKFSAAFKLEMKSLPLEYRNNSF